MNPTMNRNLTPLLGVLAALVLVTAGCAKKQVASAPVPPTPTKTDTTPTPTPKPADTPTTTPTSSAAVTDLRTVYFALDSSLLDDAARAALDADAKLLRDNAGWKIQLQGNCDERGTPEYNQALGQRRADAVRDYLVGAGVDASRLTTISYGKENPAVQGSDEAAWAKNRRVDFAKP